jgi:hypothetical protein
VKTTTAGCESTFYHYIDAAQSFGAHRFYYQWSGEPPVYLTSCQQSPTVYPHKVEQQGWQYDDPAKSAKAKTAIYITPPIGRVDVSAAQVRSGAVAVAYVYARSAETARPGSKYWVGCHAYQPTDRSDVYRRPDGTEVAFAIGPGTTAYLGDECIYTTESRIIYGYSTVTSPLALDSGSSFVGLSPGAQYSGGPYTEPHWAGYVACGNPPSTVTDYNAQQIRTRIVYPNNAGTTYTAWSTSGYSVRASKTFASINGSCG